MKRGMRNQRCNAKIDLQVHIYFIISICEGEIHLNNHKTAQHDVLVIIQFAKAVSF